MTVAPPSMASVIAESSGSPELGSSEALVSSDSLATTPPSAATGAAWLLTQGSAEALDWREGHLLAARGFIGLLVLHVVTVSLHLLDFLRD